MMTKIEWTDVTVNPFPGCKKISPGCQNCYAERLAMRLKAMGQTQYQWLVDENGWTGEVSCNVDAMKVPGKGKMVFCQSMGDLFYEGISDQQILWAYDQIRTLGLSGHTVQVLTKRPERAAELLPRIEFDGDGEGRMWYGRTRPVPFVRLLRHHWFGVTSENQEWADKRIPILLQIPVAVRFVSLEPLLGPVNLHRIPDLLQPHKGFTLTFDSLSRKGGIALREGLCLDWVIVGCESGPKRRPCDNRWIDDLVRQCHAAGVPVFVKQISVKGRVVKDANQISNIIGYPVEDIRKFPRGGIDLTDRSDRIEGDGRF